MDIFNFILSMIFSSVLFFIVQDKIIKLERRLTSLEKQFIIKLMMDEDFLLDEEDLNEFKR